jgi:hypothetical protein
MAGVPAMRGDEFFTVFLFPGGVEKLELAAEIHKISIVRRP